MAATLVLGSAVASNPSVNAVKVTDNVKTVQKSLVGPAVKIIERKALNDKGVQMLKLRDANGMVYKQIVGTNLPSKVSERKSVAREEAQSPYIYEENFMGWDGTTPDWLPEGWTTVIGEGNESANRFMVSTAGTLYEGFKNEYNAYLALDFEGAENQMLVTPEITLGENMELTYQFLDAAVSYYSLTNVDWVSYEYVGGKEVVFNEYVKISEDGGETWQVLRNYAEVNMDKSFEDLLYSMSTVLNEKISLADYAGKTVKIAFQAEGLDGDNVIVGDVKVGSPLLDLSYNNPLGALYFGFTKGSTSLNQTFNAGPVLSPVTFTNTSENPGATYEWEYMNADNEWVVSDEQNLTVTYRPDYTSAFTTRNNCYFMPRLRGASPTAAPTQYQKVGYYQAGGTADFEYSTVDESGVPVTYLENFGFAPASPGAEGYCMIVDLQTPIFGYNGSSDQYWTDYTFMGENEEGDGVEMIAILNQMFATEAPLVIDSVWVPGFARLNTAAEFKLEIIPLTEGGTLAEPIASATCTGDGFDIIDLISTGNTNNYVNACFTFDTPVVMSTEVCERYVMRLSGFHDPENVEYWAPMQSEFGNPEGYAIGWIEKNITMSGETRNSLTSVSNYTGVLQGFYMMIGGAFPWLEAQEEVSIQAGETAEATLSSYYDGAKLTVKNLPEWLSADVTGRYGEAKVVFTASGTAPTEDVTVTVEGPGVSQNIKVKANSSGIDGVNADNANGGAVYYNLQGVKVDRPADGGIYIIREANGSVRKAIRK